MLNGHFSSVVSSLWPAFSECFLGVSPDTVSYRQRIPKSLVAAKGVLPSLNNHPLKISVKASRFSGIRVYSSDLLNSRFSLVFFRIQTRELVVSSFVGFRGWRARYFLNGFALALSLVKLRDWRCAAVPVYSSGFPGDSALHSLSNEHGGGPGRSRSAAQITPTARVSAFLLSRPAARANVTRDVAAECRGPDYDSHLSTYVCTGWREKLVLRMYNEIVFDLEFQS